MCTVTFIPTGENEFILTSNRDEQPSRSAREIARTTIGSQQLIFPRDSGAGGTWIAVSSYNKLVCLLNGAFEKHERKPPYKRSRGLMVLDYFSYIKSATFFEEYDFRGIEPFTMIIYDDGVLLEVRWNEKKLYTKLLPISQSYIWSSSTLYDPAAQAKRQAWFDLWKIQTKVFDQRAIIDFHTNAGDGDTWNDVVMNRNGLVQTVSMTSISKHEEQMKLWYHDFLSGNKAKHEVELDRQLETKNT